MEMQEIPEEKKQREKRRIRILDALNEQTKSSRGRTGINDGSLIRPDQMKPLLRPDNKDSGKTQSVGKNREYNHRLASYFKAIQKQQMGRIRQDQQSHLLWITINFNEQHTATLEKPTSRSPPEKVKKRLMDIIKKEDSESSLILSLEHSRDGNLHGHAILQTDITDDKKLRDLIKTGFKGKLAEYSAIHLSSTYTQEIQDYGDQQTTFSRLMIEHEAGGVLSIEVDEPDHRPTPEWELSLKPKLAYKPDGPFVRYFKRRLPLDAGSTDYLSKRPAKFPNHPNAKALSVTGHLKTTAETLYKDAYHCQEGTIDPEVSTQGESEHE